MKVLSSLLKYTVLLYFVILHTSTLRSQVDHTCFSPTLSTYTVGTNPTAILFEKIDPNGRPDLAVVNRGSNSISVLTGTIPFGIFTPSVSYSTNNQPAAIAIADISYDGYNDMVIVNEGSNNISVLTNSVGVYTWSVDYAVGLAPKALTIFDANTDDYQDVIVANSGSNNITVLYGTITGSLTNAVNYATGINPVAINSRDFNNDGFPDLAVVNKGSNTISILLGSATGAFAPAVDYAVGSSPEGLTFGDLNVDGFIDIAVANSGSNTISVLFGSSTGTFTNSINYSVGNAPNSISCADFNNDGFPDIVTANGNSNDASILLGSSTSVFATAVNYPAGNAPSAIITADLDRNGSPDIIVANSASNTISILFNGIPKVRIVMASWGATNPKCPDTAITLTVDDQGAPNFYQWSTGALGYTISPNPSVNTTYTVSGLSTYACFYSASMTLSVYPHPNITLTTNKSIMCVGETATLEANGGATYLWFLAPSPGAPANRRYIKPTSTGVYDVIGTDVNGCMMVASVTQSVALCTGIEENQKAEELLMYPNPATGEVTLAFYNESPGATISITDIQGKQVYHSVEKNANGYYTKHLTLSELTPGLYLVKLETEQGMQVRKLIIQ